MRYNQFNKSEYKEGNHVQEAILKIQKIGAPPEGFEDGGCLEEDAFPSDELCDLWDEYQEAADSITQPVTWEEAEILIKCCPTDHMAGIEWTVLHCIESVFAPEAIEDFQSLIEKCNSDMMKNMLLERLQNYLNGRE